MLQSIVEKKIAFGLARAASIIGVNHALYRPIAANAPIAGTPFGSIYCAFDVTPDFKLLSTAQPGHSYAALLADPTLVQQGDYLVGDETHFVARVEPLRPALCVLCDQIVDFLASDITTSAGTNAYGGVTAASNVAIAQGWPVSMTARTRGEQDTTRLPSDTRAAYYDVLSPPIPGILLTFGMRMRDSNDQEYEIVSAEQSPFGWRLLAGIATT